MNGAGAARTSSQGARTKKTLPSPAIPQALPFKLLGEAASASLHPASLPPAPSQTEDGHPRLALPINVSHSGLGHFEFSRLKRNKEIRKLDSSRGEATELQKPGSKSLRSHLCRGNSARSHLESESTREDSARSLVEVKTTQTKIGPKPSRGRPHLGKLDSKTFQS